MRIGYIKLVGYIGIYNGMGLKEIAIDFSKCKYKKILIKGDNGCGKTTLRRSLHIMPDGNNVLIPGEECRKEITLLNQDMIYNIQIIHGVSGKGVRTTTKAYIQKSTPEGFLELNPNGNVTSYKEVISDELGLDPNFIALSQLSSENRGLASLKPGERKKFVTALINSTSSYNDMNKVFSKKSTLYKSMRNSILAKINNLGNIESLNTTLVNVENRYNELNEQLNLTNETISMERTKISMLDKDNSIQDRFAQISKDVKEINSNIHGIETKINTAKSNINIDIDKDNINAFYQSLINRKQELETNIKINESKVESFLIDRESDAKRLQELNGKLKSLDNGTMSKSQLIKSIEDCNKNIDYYKRMIINMKIRNIDDISKEEFILVLNTLHDIQDMISNIKDEYSYDILELSVNYIKGQAVIQTDFSELDTIDSKIDDLKYNLIKNEELIKRASILKDRPIDCDNDLCPFIKDAIEANNLNPVELYNKTTEDLNILYERKELLLNNKDLYMKVIMCSKTISTVMRNIERNTSIIRKLILDNRFMDSNRVLELITNSDIFNEVQQIYKYLDMANIIDTYKVEVKKLVNYQNQLQILSEKESITEDIIHQIKNLEDKLTDIMNNINNNNNIISMNKTELNNTNSAILDIQYIVSLYNELDCNNNNKQKLLNDFQEIKESMRTIKECVDNVDILVNKLNEINKQINPLIQERDKIKYSIKMHEEYIKELNEYNEKYEIIETLKKYSSPTYGIQTIFINMYMNKILTLANELLQLMFNGKYALCPFVINETEFRIPAISNGGIINDDVSSMSTSENNVLGVIISFAMLQQAAPNLALPLSLDEVDGGLDTNNRLYFMSVVDQIINILGTEQLFMISHNNELNTNNCDIILLKSTSEYQTIDGNIIFNYNI